MARGQFKTKVAKKLCKAKSEHFQKKMSALAKCFRKHYLLAKRAVKGSNRVGHKRRPLDLQVTSELVNPSIVGPHPFVSHFYVS